MNVRRPGGTKERFRWWVIPLGAALIPINSLWIARTEGMDYSGFPTCMSLFYNVIFCLCLLLLINIALRRWAPWAALCRRELIVLYAMLATGASFVGHDYLQMLVPSIPHASHFANSGNQWAERVVPLLPKWLTINGSASAITSYEQGHSTLYTWAHIQPWLLPVTCWSVFLFAVAACSLAINVIFRRHWVESEKLTYPIAQLPLMITEGGGSNPLFRNRVFWYGFGLAAAIDVYNGLQILFPALPAPPNLKAADIYPYFAASNTWRAIGWTPVSFYPFAIGLSFFMPKNLAFSCWFFFLFRKAQQVTAAGFGYSGGDPWFPYMKEQSYGALVVIFAACLWRSRGYLAEVWRSAISGRGTVEDGGVSYRRAFAALIAGSSIAIAFLTLAGMQVWLAAIYVALYLAFIGALARIRAELGPPTHEFGMVGPSHILIAALGTSFLGSHNLTVFSLLHFQNRMHRGMLAPIQAESLKMAGDSGLQLKTMVTALAVAAVVGVYAAFWALIHLGYARTSATPHPGAPGSAFAAEQYTLLMSWLNNPVGSNAGSITAIGVGAGFAMILSRLSTAIYGFPFHPVGYALGMSFGLDYIWLPVMISWLLKTLTLRYFGLGGYRRAAPFFAGLIVGEFTVGGLWSFVRGVLGVQTYSFFI
ncbi:MAG: hypothetical protein Q7T82_04770 [Armatimonadota bacterium]|nr:hypothetical protein [Armatimonadota bacterium]